jgi:hypothetical protein
MPGTDATCSLAKGPRGKEWRLYRWHPKVSSVSASVQPCGKIRCLAIEISTLPICLSRRLRNAFECHSSTTATITASDFVEAVTETRGATAADLHRLTARAWIALNLAVRGLAGLKTTLFDDGGNGGNFVCHHEFDL